MPLKFRNKQFKFQSGNASLIITAPIDPDEVLEKISNEEYEKDNQLPYWADLWPSSEIMKDYIAKTDFSGISTVCEIGAGLGTISSLIASLTPKLTKVVSTDINFDSTLYIKHNFGQNDLPGFAVCSDWRHSPFKTKFDLIVGADILYEERWIDSVLSFIKENMHLEGKTIISDPNRKHWNLFKEKIASKKLTISQKTTFNVEKTGGIVEIIEIIHDKQ